MPVHTNWARRWALSFQCLRPAVTKRFWQLESCSFVILVRRRRSRSRSPDSSTGTSSVTNRVQVATCLLVSSPPVAQKFIPQRLVVSHCSLKLSVRNVELQLRLTWTLTQCWVESYNLASCTVLNIFIDGFFLRNSDTYYNGLSNKIIQTSHVLLIISMMSSCPLSLSPSPSSSPPSSPSISPLLPVCSLIIAVNRPTLTLTSVSSGQDRHWKGSLCIRGCVTLHHSDNILNYTWGPWFG